MAAKKLKTPKVIKEWDGPVYCEPQYYPTLDMLKRTLGNKRPPNRVYPCTIEIPDIDDALANALYEAFEKWLYCCENSDMLNHSDDMAVSLSGIDDSMPKIIKAIRPFLENARIVVIDRTKVIDVNGSESLSMEDRLEEVGIPKWFAEKFDEDHLELMIRTVKGGKRKRKPTEVY